MRTSLQSARIQGLQASNLTLFGQSGGADLLDKLAELYRNQGHYGEAEPLHKRDMAIFEKVVGPEHPNFAKSLENNAKLLRAAEKRKRRRYAPRRCEPSTLNGVHRGNKTCH